jgi:hypothetical protein
MAALDELGLQVKIARNANELPQAIRLDEDEAHRAYDAHYARRFWQVLCHAHRVLTVFRARFRGKSSPVHFFWGNMDLALTRFSGRRAPEHPGGRPHLPDRVLRDAYSDECIEFGFWPGEDENPEPLFFCVAYPEPPGFRKAGVKPSGAHYHEALQEFVLPYEHVRQAQSPDAAVLDFFQTAYEAAAMLGRWDRKSLE